MSTFKCKHTEFSVNLANQLEEKGINDDVIQTRRKTFTRIENMYDLHFKDDVTRFLGSQSEGTVTADSDLDKLWYYKKFNVVQSDVEKVQGKCNFMIFKDETTAPGYCRIHLMFTELFQDLYSHEGTHVTLSSFRHQHLINQEELYRLGVVMLQNSIYDKNKHLCVRNQAMLKMTNFNFLTNTSYYTKRHGPTKVSESNIDNVGALPFASWPMESRDWILRKRTWPSREMMDIIKNHTCLLVPVGHRKSDQNFVEWRISYSITERYLMFNMNIVQLQCYVLLKLIKKRFLNKKVSSYHLKTILFYTVAASNENDWTKETLLSFVLRCLKTLSLWLQLGYCPHFINNEVNLFQGKFSLYDRKRLSKRVTLLIENETKYFNEINNQIMSKMNTSLHIKQHLRYVETNYRSFLTNDVFGLVNSETILPRMKLKKLYSDEELRMRDVLENGSLEEKEAAQALLPGIVGNKAAIKASEVVFNGQPVCYNILEELKSSQNHDMVSVVLKLATIHYVLRENSKVFSYFEYFIKEGSHENHLYTVCPQQMIVNETLNGNWKFACCVPICPRGLVYEMFRSTKHDRKTRYDGSESWMDTAEIDPLPYYYYIKSLLYKEQGQNEQAEGAMLEMDRYINNSHPKWNIAHPDTIYNLLGQWYANEGQSTLALKYYTLSLQRIPDNNAAKWLLGLLLYKEYSKLI